jgi:hypothetical protein
MSVPRGFQSSPFCRTIGFNNIMNLSRFIYLTLLPLLAPATAEAAQAPSALRNTIAPHRAIYEISLARSESGSGVSSAKGRMVFEVTGSVCEGYKMRQRMVVNIGDEEGNMGLLDFRVSTFESGDGNVYTFDSRTELNDEVVEAVEGEARRNAAAIEVSLKQPTEKKVTLDGGVLFPSQHMQAIIDAAIADRRFISTDIYEGAGTGDSSDEAATAIGRALTAGADSPLRSGVRHWPISVGYFDPTKKVDEGLGEEVPSYQMSFTLYENGVTSDLVMDYGDYALTGSLQKIEALTSPDCSR